MSAPAAPGASRRMIGFIAHLRGNGFAVGPAETADALAFVARAGMAEAALTRGGLKAMLAGDRGQWERFDDLFDAYWHRRGVRSAVPAGETGAVKHRRPALWDRLLPAAAGDRDTAPGVGGGEGEAADASIVASDREALMRVDLRDLVTPQAVAEAERVAERLARAIRYRLSRRRRPSAHGRALDLRRTIRRNMGRGGEPLDLVWRKRPDRPVRIVVLLDVSGSMKSYSRFFLLFVRGLLCRWVAADAYLFHTRLAWVSEALRDRDPLRAMGRLSLMTQGFGGGTRIASCLATFNDRHAKRAINSRTVVIIMSDGYDTDPPEALAAELARLKRRARRLIWLNPLLGWRDYAPVARGMAAALPYIDHFAAANTLEALAALEPELAKL